jgi:N-methylhydantoinase B/oxoprolinase/acetone carboxylase alpha subunit
LSVGVFDRHGRMVAQGPYSPGHMGAMSFAVRNAGCSRKRLAGLRAYGVIA